MDVVSVEWGFEEVSYAVGMLMRVGLDWIDLGREGVRERGARETLCCIRAYCIIF